MGLVYWLPLINDVHNQGLEDVDITYTNLTWVNGKIGTAPKWSLSTNDTLYLRGAASRMCNMQYYSMCAWVKVVDSFSGHSQAIISSGNWNQADTLINFAIEKSGSSVKMLITASRGWDTGVDITDYFTFDEWHHVCMTWDGNKTNAYVDGVLCGSIQYGGMPSTYDVADILIGGATYIAPTFRFNGLMNDIRIYDHCLSPLEVKEISKGLVLHYPLSMPGGENLYNHSKDFSGTWVNGANWVTDSEQYNGFVVKKKSSIWGGLAQNVPCSNGDIFTISFYAKVDSGGNILSIHRSSLGNVTTGLTILGGNFTSGTDWATASQTATSWKKYWATVQITSTDITYLQWRIENSVADKFLYVCGMKLERGSRPTPWIPNPADAEYSALGFDDGIEYDVSGYGNNGIRNGTFSWSSDTPRYNASTQIDGSIITCESGLVSVADPVFSVSLWFRLKSNTSYTIYQDLINFASPSYSNQPFRLEICGSPVGNDIDWFRGPAGSTGGFKVNNTALSRDVWYHTVLVSEGNKQYSYYMNGVKQGTYNGSANTWTPTGSVRIGDSIAGKIDVSDFRIYATALSADDVRDLYSVAASISDNGTLMASEVSEV